MDYSTLTTEQLEEKLRELEGQRADLKAESVAITQVLDGRRVEDAARKKLEAMSDGERAALARLISTEGIKSAETVSEV
jgi:hypothetical protein